MFVNKENYELYFLDYHEGRLSAAEQAELMDFLVRYPELQQEFDAFEQLSLSADEDISYPDKGMMKRGGISPENYNYYFAAYVSGDLDIEEASGVEAFVAGDKQMARELELMKLTVLQTGDDIVFEGKDDLKRSVMSVSAAAQTASADAASAAVYPMGQAAQGAERQTRRRLGGLYYYAAAAAVLLMAGMFFLRMPDMSIQEYTEEIPAVGDAEPTVAVAEVPSPREDAMPSIEPATVQAVLEVNTPGSTNIPEYTKTPGSAPAISPRTNVSEVRPLFASRMPQRSPQLLQAKNNLRDVSAPDVRTDFEGWHLRQRTEGNFVPAMTESRPKESTLVQYAVNQLQQALPVDRNEIDRQLTNTRSSVREYADQGLSGIGSMAVNALGVETSRDEEGRLRQFAIGELFAITRK